MTGTQDVHQRNAVLAHIVQGHTGQLICNALSTIRRVYAKDLAIQSHVHFRELIENTETGIDQVHQAQDFSKLFVLTGVSSGFWDIVCRWSLHDSIEKYADNLSRRGHGFEGAAIFDTLGGVFLQFRALAQVQVGVQGFILRTGKDLKGYSYVNKMDKEKNKKK